MNTAFRDLLVARAAAMIAAGKAIGAVQHAALKGQLREIVVRDLLRPLFPPTIGIGHGVVVTAYEQQSTEQDIVVFNRAAVPSLVTDELNGLFPVEAVLVTIEVKSILTLKELREAHRKARSNEGLLHIPGEHAPEHFIQCLFALDSNLSKKSDLERYQDILGSTNPAIRMLCVAGRGCWFWESYQWKTVAASQSYAEILGFVASIVNVYDRVATSRVRPNLFKYVS
jgi:hypothetical protein